MKRIARNLDFFKSILRENNRHRRLEKLLHANKDQINAVSEFTINMLKNNFPLPPHVVAKLRKHKDNLREVSKRKNSLKIRRQVLMNQKGGCFWSGLNEALCCCMRWKEVEVHSIFE